MDGALPSSSLDSPSDRFLALPHLLDEEWRFTDEVADRVAEMAAGSTKAGDTIFLMGVPSVALAALRTDHDRRFVFLGEDNVIARGVRERAQADRRFEFGAPSFGEADLAVIDPPYSDAAFNGMMNHASAYCRIGAQILVGAPPRGILPRITKTVDDVIATAQESGADLVGEERFVLQYRTPFFELKVLEGSRFKTMPSNWRRADLLRFHKLRQGPIFPPYAPKPSFEVTLGGVRLRLLSTAGFARGSDENQTLTPLHEGEVFPSVSTRAPRRGEANFWTSGNRAYSVDPVAALKALLRIADAEGLSSGLSGEALEWARTATFSQPLIDQIRDLASREAAEAAAYSPRIVWNREANDARILSGSWTDFFAVSAIEMA